jgi:hypothetical protein
MVNPYGMAAGGTESAWEEYIATKGTKDTKGNHSGQLLFYFPLCLLCPLWPCSAFPDMWPQKTQNPQKGTLLEYSPEYARCLPFACFPPIPSVSFVPSVANRVFCFSGKTATENTNFTKGKIVWNGPCLRHPSVYFVLFVANPVLCFSGITGCIS